MIKDTIAASEAVTPNSRDMAVLKDTFQSCFHADGSFDLDRFKAFLSDQVSVVDEGYELRFLGKNYARLLASLNTTTVIVPDDEHNAKPENAHSENVYISGDNLDGLKHLLKSYARKVKCIYLRHDYEHGKNSDIRKKRNELFDCYRHYTNRSVLQKQRDYVTLQRRLYDEILALEDHLFT